MAKDLKKGIFITFEGVEGSGKSTQASLLYEFLKKKYKVVYLREPGATKLGEMIREILLNSNKVKITPITEAFLYVTARSQLVKEKIQPALEKKQIVICDRFSDSTLVYQGYGLGIGRNILNKLNSLSIGKIKPDITFIMDVKISTGLSRSKKAKGYNDRIEKRCLSFHEKVRKGYIDIAKKNPKRIKIFSTENTESADIFRNIKKHTLKVVSKYE